MQMKEFLGSGKVLKNFEKILCEPVKKSFMEYNRSTIADPVPPAFQSKLS